MRRPSYNVSFFILIVLLIPLLAHCGRGQTAAEEAAQPVELLWMTFDLDSQVEDTLATNFRQEYPNITFQRQPLNFDTDYLAASPAPDMLMTFANHAFFQAGRTNQLVDLDEVWLNASLDEGVLPNVQELVKNGETGKQHMLPVAFSWAAIYYNKAVFAQHNLQEPQSWDEFMQLCAILQANGEIPLAMAGAGGYSYTLWFDYLNLRLNGAEYHRELLAGRERFDDPRVGFVLETWRNLFQQGFVVPNPERMDATDAINALIRGDNGLLGDTEATMALMDTYTLNEMLPELRTELDFFRFPIMDPTVPPAESIDVIGYIIPINAAHGLQAQRFLTYLGAPAAQTLIAREASVINAVFAPVRTDIEADAVTAEMEKATRMVYEATEVVPFTAQTMPPALWTDYSRLYRLLLNDPQDIQSFIDAMEAARQDALENGSLE
jgi:ABC-type glycerol-3-phosphate transport system substrate-binding protein